MWLIVDDTRELGCEVVAKTSEAGIAILKLIHESGQNPFEAMCIDHDLGLQGGDGLDVIRYGIEYDCLPPHVQIVSQNPVGAENIRNQLVSAGYVSKDRINYYKQKG